MATSTKEIYEEIVAAIEAEPNLSELDSKSQTAKWSLIAFIVAVSINLMEQLFDLFNLEIDTKLSNGVPGTLQWCQAKTLEFQYSEEDPQNLILVDLVPIYPEIVPAYQIITRSSVTETTNLGITIKVAKSEPPEPLNNLEKIALSDYWSTLPYAGTSIEILSEQPDRLFINSEIYYDGAFAGSIETNVKNALSEYLQNLSSAANFNGVVRNSSVVDAIQAVQGVIDVKLIQTKGRAFSEPFSQATIIDLKYTTFAGYVVEEDTPGNTFDDTLVFKIEG